MTSTSAVIEVCRLRKRYGDTEAVQDVSFSVRPGEIFGVLGPNGAGKTTTVECVVGLRRPDAGTVRVCGLDPVADHHRVTGLLGVQLQSGRLPAKITVAEALALYASFYPDPVEPGELIERLGLGDRRDARFATLSGGQQQRLSLALALVGRPRVAVLDELTTGLDPQARREAWSLIESVRDSGVSILLVTHFMEEAQRLCDRLALIDRGRVAALGTPAELVESVSGAGQQLSFRVEGAVDVGMLTDLAEVSSAHADGGRVSVTGTGDVVLAVTAVLARAGVVAHDLRIRQADLDDAFVAITNDSLRELT